MNPTFVNIAMAWTWWRRQMETFSALLAICTGNSPVTGEFHAQRPVTRSFDVFSDLRLNKRLSEQWRAWWFETPSRPLWRYCNETLSWLLALCEGKYFKTTGDRWILLTKGSYWNFVAVLVVSLNELPAIWNTAMSRMVQFIGNCAQLMNK